nr:molybdopterin dinucleotide binding domain-containing protein [Sphingomonas sp. CDS-1]
MSWRNRRKGGCSRKKRSYSRDRRNGRRVSTWVLHRSCRIWLILLRESPRQRRHYSYNPAFMHPDNMAAIGVAEGETVLIRSKRASVLGIAAADEGLRPGCVSMSHAGGGAPDETNSRQSTAPAPPVTAQAVRYRTTSVTGPAVSGWRARWIC